MAGNNNSAFKLWQEIAADLSSGQLKFATFADATVTIRMVLKKKDRSTEELARLVSADPMISARLVKMANSAAVSRGGKSVADVKSAVIRLGHGAVHSIVAATALDQVQQAKELTAHRPQAKALWQHSVQVAAIAHVLARKSGKVSAEEALFAGLVHDVGYFFLLARLSRIQQVAGSADGALALLVDWHTSIGKALLDTLEIPETVAGAVEEHELDPDQLNPKTLSEVLALANRCATFRNPFVASSEPKSTAGFSVSEEDLRSLLAESAQDIKSLMASLRGES